MLLQAVLWNICGMHPDFRDHALSNSRLGELVRSVWSLDYGCDTERLEGLIGPDCQVEFVFQLGDPCRLSDGGSTRATPRAMIYGLRHGMLRMLPDGANMMVSFRVAAAVACAILRAPLLDCWDRPVPLTELIGSEADSLLDQLASTPRAAIGTVIETWLVSRLRDWSAEDARQLAIQNALLSRFAGHRLSRLSEEVGISDRTLRRFCERHAGLSPKQLVMSGRMLRGCVLLRDRPGMPIAEVADQLGFNDQPAFANAFRHYVGMTPARLRAEPLVYCALP
ncbi:helix-turn-helix transcriptional regulator [Sphingomonas sp. LB-2]|uniref:helix-turn-helix transcriptional regulator n=1 Tax=Sphingomonas caeni TaxID=2984949 RepID=UPI00222E2799|nr:helix-turn-helix transcriptional regulator [Sphingomonas caeni]MCW3847895.1 helix-turn-helix transcriptional regulator [Sphingomonas caeni]